jgi:hypothetical protein
VKVTEESSWGSVVTKVERIFKVFIIKISLYTLNFVVKTTEMYENPIISSHFNWQHLDLSILISWPTAY